MPPRIYLDHNATSPLLPEAREAMMVALAAASRGWGNPSSPHDFGHAARIAVEEARMEVALLLGAHPREIVFVSGGTEADNLAVQGVARARVEAGGPPGRVVTSAVEHPAVLESCRRLERDGWGLTVLPVDRDGVVDPEDVRRAAAASETTLVSVMTANNETGVLQPVAEIAAIARETRAIFHTDAVQAAGRIALDAARSGVDLLSISAHKMGGPCGIGALYLREGVGITPVIVGGGQERRRRAGTEPVILAAGFAAAARAARDRLGTGATRDVGTLRDRLEREILARIDGVRVNGAAAPRLPNTSSLTISGVDNEALVIRLDLLGVAISTGSACSTGSARPSHVLAAMGLTAEASASTIRVSIGPATTTAEIDTLVETLAGAIRDLRLARSSPLAGAMEGIR